MFKFFSKIGGYDSVMRHFLIDFDQKSKKNAYLDFIYFFSPKRVS